MCARTRTKSFAWKRLHRSTQSVSSIGAFRRLTTTKSLRCYTQRPRHLRPDIRPPTTTNRRPARSFLQRCVARLDALDSGDLPLRMSLDNPLHRLIAGYAAATTFLHTVFRHFHWFGALLVG